MFTPTLRCECAQPGLIDTMRKWSIQCAALCITHYRGVPYARSPSFFALFVFKTPYQSFAGL